MASDQDIVQALSTILRETNPSALTTLNDVILSLQSKLGVDLSNRIDFIRAQINLLLTPPPPQHPNLNPNPTYPNPNPNPPYHVFQQHHHAHSHFPGSFVGGPRGPTEISFAQPAGVGVGVANADAHSSTPVKPSAPSRPKRRGGPGGLNKLCAVSPLLQTIVGQPAMPRTEIVKQLWAYIRKNNLQDPSNKRKIICNDELRLVFETDCTDMFQMNKLLAKHITPLDPTKESGQQSKKVKVEESQAPTAPATEPSTDSTEPAPIVISEALAKFFGTNEKEMLQSEVYKRVEEYIKAEGLEDRLNSVVICDTKLQELFGCESIPTPGIREELVRNHLFQRA